MGKYEQQVKELKKLSDKIDDRQLALKIYMAAMSICELNALYETTKEALLEYINDSGDVK